MVPPYCAVPSAVVSEPEPAVTKPPCVSLALLVMTLMTPFTALAPHTVPPGPRITSITFDILQYHVLRIPIHSREERVIHRSAIDQNQHLVGVQVGEAPDADRPGVGVHS